MRLASFVLMGGTHQVYDAVLSRIGRRTRKGCDRGSEIGTSQAKFIIKRT